MTMKVFLGFSRKPAKSPASSVARAFGMTEQPSDDGNWVFGKGRFRVRLEDLRTDMQPEYREWADEVGWAHNWAVSIAVHDRNRTDIDYIKWHSLVAVIMEAYELNLLWTDQGTDTPQYNMRLNDFMPNINSSEADDLNQDVDVEEPVPEAVVEEKTAQPEPIEKSEPEIPDSVMEALRAQVKAEMEAEPVENVPEQEVEAPKQLVELEPVEEDSDFDTFDDWDDDDDDEDDDDDDSENTGADLEPIVDWD